MQDISGRSPKADDQPERQRDRFDALIDTIAEAIRCHPWTERSIPVEHREMWAGMLALEAAEAVWRSE